MKKNVREKAVTGSYCAKTYKVQGEDYDITEYTGRLIRMQAIFHPRTCMAKRYDRNTPQYNPGDTRIQGNRRFKDIPVYVQGTTQRTFRVIRLNFA